MRRDIGDDIPVRRAGFSIRSPFAVMVLMPLQLPITLAVFAVSIVFTIWPDALQHSPISWETQGLVHHIWHYSLLVGSLMVLVGMFWVSPRRLQAELAGLFILIGALSMNLVAQVSLIISPGGSEEPSGLALAVRAGIVTGMLIRAYIIIRQPVVKVVAATTKEDVG